MKKRILLPLLLICLLLAACQNEVAPTTTAQSPDAPTKGTTAPTTVPPTSTIAPTDAPTNIIHNAQKITVGMTEADVYDLLHIEGDAIFSGVAVYKWELDNGKLLYVWFHPSGEEMIAGGTDICDARQSWPGDRALEDDSQHTTLTKAESVDDLQVGMKYDDVCTQLESNGILVCQDAQVVQYPLLNGGYALIWYAEIDDVKTVCKIEVQDGALA